MYILNKIETKGLQFIELYNPENKNKVVLCLNQGGRLCQLEFGGINVLADFEPSTYAANYASSILFPFVNRIRDGKYTFDGVDYVLECNETDKNNALHGLVYDKVFECMDYELDSNSASVILQYTYNKMDKGFPFEFDIRLTYTVSESKFGLSVAVVNIGNKPLPFTIGWHPYFVSENLDKSALDFESNTKYVCDRQQIVSGTTSLDVEMPFQLKDAKLDDGYALQNNAIAFLTPKYRLDITSTSEENYLQLYTPSAPNVIAIEPMTGAADSFNNKIGLQILPPQHSYVIVWDITFKHHEDQLTTN